MHFLERRFVFVELGVVRGFLARGVYFSVSSVVSAGINGTGVASLSGTAIL